MKFDKYLIDKEITSQEFATQIGASYSAVCKWRINGRKPRAEWILKISKATKNRVSIADWVDGHGKDKLD